MTGEEFDAIVAPARELIAKKGEDYRAGVVKLCPNDVHQDHALAVFG